MLRTSTSFLFLVVALSFSILLAVPVIDSNVYAGSVNTDFRRNDLSTVSRDLPHPEVEVEPNAIEEELNTGESLECVLNFSNIGDENVNFRIEYEIINQPDRDVENTRRRGSVSNNVPTRDDPGEVLFQLELENIWLTGFDWNPDDNVMWVASYSPPRIHAYEYDGAGEIELVFDRQLNNNSMAMAYLDGVIYTNQYPTNLIYLYNEEGEALDEFEINCRQSMDLATSKEEGWLFAISGGNRQIYVYDVADDYQNIGIIETPQEFNIDNGVRAGSICWVDDHPEGQLWFGSEDRVWQYFVDTENWQAELVQDFETPCGTTWLGIGHDGENIWRPNNSDEQLVRIYDDGISEIRWISFDPDEGELEAGADLDIIVTLDATGLIGGEYEADIHFISDDPDNPDLVVSIIMFVNGAPNLEIEWSENIGFPDVVDWNLHFEDVFPGESYDIPVELTNTGTEVLNVEEIFSEHDYFSADFEEPVEIQIRETVDVNFNFSGQEPDEFEATMIVISDDPDEGRIEIELHANALSPPVAAIEPDEFSIDLINNEEAELVVNIVNEGESVLRWESDLEIVDGREEDDRRMRRNVRRVNGANSFPLRDQVEGRGILITEPCGWDRWDFGQYFREIEDLEYDRFTFWDQVEEVDFNDYDFMWLGNFQTEAWVDDYNQNLERIEEFIDNGGTLYHSSGTNRHNLRPVNPGGLVYTWGEMEGDSLQDNCPLNLNPEDNFLINYMNDNDEFNWEWREGQRLQGGAHGVFRQQDIDELENSNWHQIIAMGNPINEPIILVYSYGNGYVVASTTVDGYLHARMERFQWGRTGIGIIHYLDFLSTFSDWLTWEPHSGELEPDENENVLIALDADGLVTSEYNANIIVETNDPALEEFVIEITLNVTGIPIIEVAWSEDAGYPDLINWNGVYDELFTGEEYPITIEIINVGTDELIVEDISFNNDYFNPNRREIVVPALDSRIIELTLFAEEDGEHEGTLTIISNDPDNEEIQIVVQGTTISSPIMEIEPEMIDDEMIEGDVSVHVVTITNVGAVDLIWTSDADIINEPDLDRKTRSMRNSRSNRIGPKRDPLANGAFNDLRFACFTTNSDWGWIDDGMRQDPLLNRRNLVSFRRVNDLDGFDFWDYDGVVFNLYNQRFMNHFNANMERLTDYIDGGGGLYFETGMIQRHSTPGGISNDQNDRSVNGMFLVSPNRMDENYSRFAEILHASEPDYWLDGEIIEGDPWLYSTYSHGQFERGVRNGIIDWFQPIASMEDDRDRWGAVAYGIGRGIVLTVGHPPGDCWFNWAEDGGQWGSIAAEILYYISQTTSQWLDWEPKNGIIPPGRNEELTITLNSNGLLGGVYRSEILLFSNDPAAPEGEPDQTISVVMEITGEGQIVVEPGGPDDEPFDFGIGYIGFPKLEEFSISNEGTDVLTVIEAISNNEVFFVDEEVEFPFDLEVDEEVIINVAFNAREREENQEATIAFITDPPHEDWEDGYPVRLTGDGLEAPIISVIPDEIGGDYGDGDEEEFALTIANEGEGVLIWDTNFELFEQPGIDNQRRSIRKTKSSHGPNRDEPGDIIDQFNSGITRCAGMTSTHDGRIWGCAYFTNRVIAMDIENGEILNNWEGPGRPLGMTWTGEDFWIGDHRTPTIFRYDVAGELIEQFDLNFERILGIGCDRQNFAYINATEQDENIIHIIDIEEHNEVGTFSIRNAVGNNRVGCITWVPEHPDGQLWGLSDERICQVVIDEERNAELIQEFEALVDSRYCGLGHDGENIWFGMWEEEDWYKIEDGIQEMSPLISWDPTSGELAEGEDIDVIATITTADLADGFYEGTLFFISNDPETPVSEVNVRVSVNGRSFITAEPVQPVPVGAEEDAIILFEEAYIGVAPSEFILTIQNTGEIELEIAGIEIEGENVDDFSHNIEDGVVIPSREEIDVTLTFQPDEAGQKNAILTLQTDAMNVEDGIVWWNLTGMGLAVPEPEHFTLPFDRENAPEARHLLIANELRWDDEISPAGWEIGVFTENEELGGSVVWLGVGAVEFLAYGVDEGFEGFEEGGSFIFRIWDNEADAEGEIEPVFTDGPEVWADEGETTLELHGREQTDLILELAESWNIISINVDPVQFYANEDDPGPDVQMMFEQLEDEDGNQRIILLKDDRGQFWVPGWDFNNIGFWILTRGYQICLTEAAEATIRGRIIPPDADIPLEHGWNMIAYFPDYDLDASAPDFYVLSPIIENVIIAKDVQGRFMSTEFEFSDMVPWTQGQGYQVKIDVDDPIVLNYPPEREELERLENEELTASQAGSSQNMSVLVNSIYGIDLSNGDRISAYSSSGLKVGSGEFNGDRCGFAVWGDEENTDTAEGALSGETFTLKFWDADNEVERNIDIISILKGNALFYKSNSLLVVDIAVQSAVPENYYLSQNYPNPFNSVTRFSFGCPEISNISVRVYDMSGRLVKELLNDAFRAGNHSITWDTRNVSAGIYLVKLGASNGFKSVVKVTLIK